MNFFTTFCVRFCTQCSQLSSATRFFCLRISAAFIPIVLSKMLFYFAGGQNVNKLNTKAELRFHVANADWLSADVKGRLHAQQANRINNEGELLVTSQEHRYIF
jgi:uncharacterized membrane protein